MSVIPFYIVSNLLKSNVLKDTKKDSTFLQKEGRKIREYRMIISNTCEQIQICKDGEIRKINYESERKRARPFTIPPQTDRQKDFFSPILGSELEIKRFERTQRNRRNDHPHIPAQFKIWRVKMFKL